MIDYKKELSKIMKSFGRSYINQYLELIIVEKTNTFIRLEDVCSASELKMKVLVVVSRNCCKSEPFSSSSANARFQKSV